MTKSFKFPDELLLQHLAIVGKTGSGKTYTGKGMVERLLAHQRRVCILDPTGVWWGLRSTASGKGAGFSVVVFGGLHADVPIADTSGAALAKIIAAKNLPAIIDLSEMLSGARHRFVTDFMEALYRDNHSPLHLIIDEADEFAPQNPLPETKRMLHHVDRIVRRGRSRGFRVMLITQRPAVLHKNVLTQANTLIAMRLTAPQDRNAIKAWIDGQGDVAQGKVLLDSLPRLQRGEGWVWAPELDILERTVFPKIDTFDSSRTPENDETVQQPSKLAPVDLSEIKATFGAIEKEAADLKTLTAELAKARAELAKSPKAAGGVSAAEVAKAVEAAGRHGYEQALQHVATAMQPEVAKVAAALAALVEAAGKLPKLTLPALPAWPAGERLAAWSGTAAPRPSLPAPPPRAAAPTPAPAREEPPGVRDGRRPDSAITAPMLRILDTLAKLESFGIETPSKVMVAAHGGVRPGSGSYSQNLGDMRKAGLVDYPIPGAVTMTSAGKLLATYPAKAMTLEDLHESWLSIVSGPQAAILRELIAAYPDGIAKEALAARLGVAKGSGSYSQNLSDLRTLGAAEYPSKGTVAASALLFPKGKP